MANFKYIARDTTGERKEGVRQAVSASNVLSWLRELGLTPVSVTELSTVTTKQRTRTPRRKRIKSADLSALFWQLTTMLEGGIPITTALDTIGEDVDNVCLQQIMKHLLDRIQKGQTFSDSMAE